MTSPETVPVIAIDGPGGAGKGTVSRAIADSLRWHYLDSGALYRVAGLAVREAGLSLGDGAAVGAFVAGLEIGFETGPGGEERAMLDGRNVAAEIRSEDAGRTASAVAAVPEVRKALIRIQRAFCRTPGLVADGRDMGTVLFPQARLKIYLTATAGERAARRHKQLKDKGMDVSLAALLTDITERDRRDAQRAVAPLKPAFDAVCIDTTGVPIERVVNQVLALAGQEFGSATK